MRMPGDRERIRQFSTISLLNLLRMRLDARRCSPMARAFVAVRPPDAVLADGRRARSRVVRGPPARRALDDAGAVAPHAAVPREPGRPRRGRRRVRARCAWPAGDVRLGGGGAFPSERRAKVLWLGRGRGRRAPRRRLAGAVGALLAPLGHEPEDRPFHAHLTLARLARPTDVRDRSSPRSGPTRWASAWTVPARSLLYESHHPPPKAPSTGSTRRFPLRLTGLTAVVRRCLLPNGCSASVLTRWNYTPVIPACRTARGRSTGVAVTPPS